MARKNAWRLLRLQGVDEASNVAGDVVVGSGLSTGLLDSETFCTGDLLLGEALEKFNLSSIDETAHEIWTDKDFMGAREGSLFLMRLVGEDLRESGILPGDLMVVEKRSPEEGDVVVAIVGQSFVLRRFFQGSDGVYLFSEDVSQPLIQFDPTLGHAIIGVATKVIRDLS